MVVRADHCRLVWTEHCTNNYMSFIVRRRELRVSGTLLILWGSSCPLWAATGASVCGGRPLSQPIHRFPPPTGMSIVVYRIMYGDSYLTWTCMYVVMVENFCECPDPFAGTFCWMWAQLPTGELFQPLRRGCFRWEHGWRWGREQGETEGRQEYKWVKGILWLYFPSSDVTMKQVHMY